jgi:hypothetical protein
MNTSTTVGDSMTTVDLDTTATEGMETSTGTGPPQPCMNDAECMDEARPFCSPVLQECVNCAELPDPVAECTSMNPALPVCDDGVCVQCTAEMAGTCSGATPVCDDATNSCIACTEHAQCGESACNWFNGSCVAGPVVSVGEGDDLAGAVDGLGGGGTIHLGEGNYDDAVTVGGGVVVAFLAEAGVTPVWQRSGGVGAPQLRVTGGATVLMDGIELRNNPSAVDPALRVDGAMLWVDRATIAQNSGVAVSAEVSAELVLRNCFVGGSTDLAALNVADSSVTIQYTTVGAGLGDTTAIACNGASDVTVSDSIILSRGAGPAITCAGLTADHTAANTMIAGTANADVGATMTTWFTAYNTGDFHLSAAGQAIFADIAEWNAGDPLDDPAIDIDGDPRSGVDNTPEHAGADLP